MSITILADVIMPNNVLSAGVRGKNMRQNQRAMNQAGFVTANIVWTKTLRQYELGTVPMLIAQWQAIEGLHEVTEGGAYGFLMEDPKDNTVSATEGVLQPMVSGVAAGTAGAGYGVPTYQLAKRYTSSGSTRTKDRAITRPKGVPVFLRGGSPVTVGSGAGNVAYDANTGAVTFVADSTKSVSALSSKTITGITKANPGVVTCVAHGFASGDKIKPASVVGMTQVNGNYYTITSLTADTFSIGVDTTGYTTYTSGGTATKYGITQTSPVRVNSAAHGFTNGQVVYLSGVVGTTEVNSLPFTVANAATNYFELSGINGSAYTAYVSGGTISKFAQSTESLTWSGRFYVPVQFMDDTIEWDMVRAGQFEQRLVAGPSVVLIEVRE